MGTLKVTVEGEQGFIWTYTGEELKWIIEEACPRFADEACMDTVTFANYCVRFLLEKPDMADDHPRKVCGVVWLILTSDMDSAYHPGKIGDYAEHMDFEVDVTRMSGGDCMLTCNAVSRLAAL